MTAAEEAARAYRRSFEDGERRRALSTPSGAAAHLMQRVTRAFAAWDEATLQKDLRDEDRRVEAPCESDEGREPTAEDVLSRVSMLCVDERGAKAAVDRGLVAAVVARLWRLHQQAAEGGLEEKRSAEAKARRSSGRGGAAKGDGERRLELEEACTGVILNVMQWEEAVIELLRRDVKTRTTLTSLIDAWLDDAKDLSEDGSTPGPNGAGGRASLLDLTHHHHHAGTDACPAECANRTEGSRVRYLRMGVVSAACGSPALVRLLDAAKVVTALAAVYVNTADKAGQMQCAGGLLNALQSPELRCRAVERLGLSPLAHLAAEAGDGKIVAAVLQCLWDECVRAPPLAVRLIGEPGSEACRTLVHVLGRAAVADDEEVRRRGEALVTALAESAEEGTRVAFGAALEGHIAPLLAVALGVKGVNAGEERGGRDRMGGGGFDALDERSAVGSRELPSVAESAALLGTLSVLSRGAPEGRPPACLHPGLTAVLARLPTLTHPGRAARSDGLPLSGAKGARSLASGVSGGDAPVESADDESEGDGEEDFDDGPRRTRLERVTQGSAKESAATETEAVAVLRCFASHARRGPWTVSLVDALGSPAFFERVVGFITGPITGPAEADGGGMWGSGKKSEKSGGGGDREARMERTARVLALECMAACVANHERCPAALTWLPCLLRKLAGGWRDTQRRGAGRGENGGGRFTEDEYVTAAAAPLMRVSVRALLATAGEDDETRRGAATSGEDGGKEGEDGVNAVLELIREWLLAGRGCAPQARATALSALHALTTHGLHLEQKDEHGRERPTASKKGASRHEAPGAMYKEDDDEGGEKGEIDVARKHPGTPPRDSRVRRKALAWLRSHPEACGAGVVSLFKPAALAKLPPGGPLAAVDLAVKVLSTLINDAAASDCGAAACGGLVRAGGLAALTRAAVTPAAFNVGAQGGSPASVIPPALGLTAASAAARVACSVPGQTLLDGEPTEGVFGGGGGLGATLLRAVLGPRDVRNHGAPVHVVLDAQLAGALAVAHLSGAPAPAGFAWSARFIGFPTAGGRGETKTKTRLGGGGLHPASAVIDALRGLVSPGSVALEPCAEFQSHDIAMYKMGLADFGGPAALRPRIAAVGALANLALAQARASDAARASGTPVKDGGTRVSEEYDDDAARLRCVAWGSAATAVVHFGAKYGENSQVAAAAAAAVANFASLRTEDVERALFKAKAARMLTGILLGGCGVRLSELEEPNEEPSDASAAVPLGARNVSAVLVEATLPAVLGLTQLASVDLERTVVEMTEAAGGVESVAAAVRNAATSPHAALAASANRLAEVLKEVARCDGHS